MVVSKGGGCVVISVKLQRYPSCVDFAISVGCVEVISHMGQKYFLHTIPAVSQQPVLQSLTNRGLSL
jgi:hypothetical protein